jgi:thiosulfate dehydrogenase [quinone] large subunit
MPTRRDFLKTVCGAAALALGPVLLADEAMAADGIRRKANGQVVVTLAKVPGLARVGGTVALGSVRGVPVAVVRTGRRSYRAIDLRCTHQGVTVGKSGSAWLCPAHGSRFAGDGTVTGGPAQRSLATVESSLADGRLTVG